MPNKIPVVWDKIPFDSQRNYRMRMCWAIASEDKSKLEELAIRRCE